MLVRPTLVFYFLDFFLSLPFCSNRTCWLRWFPSKYLTVWRNHSGLRVSVVSLLVSPFSMIFSPRKRGSAFLEVERKREVDSSTADWNLIERSHNCNRTRDSYDQPHKDMSQDGVAAPAQWAFVGLKRCYLFSKSLTSRRQVFIKWYYII